MTATHMFVCTERERERAKERRRKGAGNQLLKLTGLKDILVVGKTWPRIEGEGVRANVRLAGTL